MGALCLALAPQSRAAGDAANGERLHESCLSCHGTGIYLPPKRKIKTLAALRKETARWGDYYNPKFTRAEIDDLVAYLNRDFYKFP
ncbi:MAG: cytochrome c [Betaproteobacteria bacterium]|nr:cytochrome c [Betaproteobacteria bacterium]